jgi:hypothetical protein
VSPEDGLKAGMNDSFNSYITAAKYPNKLSHKMGHACRVDGTGIGYTFKIFILGFGRGLTSKIGGLFWRRHRELTGREWLL